MLTVRGVCEYVVTSMFTYSKCYNHDGDVSGFQSCTSHHFNPLVLSKIQQNLTKEGHTLVAWGYGRLIAAAQEAHMCVFTSMPDLCQVFHNTKRMWIVLNHVSCTAHHFHPVVLSKAKVLSYPGRLWMW